MIFESWGGSLYLIILQVLRVSITSQFFIGKNLFLGGLKWKFFGLFLGIFVVLFSFYFLIGWSRERLKGILRIRRARGIKRGPVLLIPGRRAWFWLKKVK